MKTKEEQEDEQRGYVPLKIQAMAKILMEEKNADETMDKLRAMYPNLNTLRGSLCKLKAAVLAANVRPPEYHAAMQTWEDDLKAYAAEHLGDAPSLQRMREFYDFQNCSLKRQLHVQKKIALGQGAGFFSFPEDLAKAATLNVAPDYVHRLHLSAEEMRTVQETQAAKLRCLSNTVVRIENADELVAHARRTLKNAAHENLCGVAAAIALVTGRRMVEIFQRGMFTVDPGHKYRLMFTGQAKAGLQEISGIATNTPMAYSIPVLAHAGNVVKAVATLRERGGDTPAMDAKKVNSVWCRKLNKYVKTHVHEDVGFHDLRTMFALISYEACKPHTYSINAWICNVLGHQGLGMSVHYTRMQVYGVNKLRRHNRESCEDFNLEE